MTVVVTFPNLEEEIDKAWDEYSREILGGEHSSDEYAAFNAGFRAARTYKVNECPGP